jgi:hypothetical protein
MPTIAARGALKYSDFLSKGVWLSGCATGKVDFLLWAEQYVSQFNLTPGLPAWYLVSGEKRSSSLPSIKPQPERHQ